MTRVLARAVAVASRAMPRIMRSPVRVWSSGPGVVGASHSARVATRVPVSAAAVSSAAATACRSPPGATSTSIRSTSAPPALRGVT